MITLRVRYLPVPPRPNAVESVVLDPAHDFTMSVKVVETALARNQRFAVKDREGTLVLVDPRYLQTIALRESH